MGIRGSANVLLDLVVALAVSLLARIARRALELSLTHTAAEAVTFPRRLEAIGSHLMLAAPTCFRIPRSRALSSVSVQPPGMDGGGMFADVGLGFVGMALLICRSERGWS